MSKISILQRNGIIYVAPNDGIIDLEPVERVTVSDDLADAVGRALKAAPKAPPSEFPNLRNYVDPVRKAAGVRSALQFERGLKLLSLENANGEYVVQRLVPNTVNGRGFDLDAILFRLLEDTPLSTVAARINEAFSDPAWPVR